MKLVFVVLGLLLLPFCFADAAPPCSVMEYDCIRTCCIQGGGTPAENIADMEPITAVNCSNSTDVIDTCIYAGCRPNRAECEAHGYGCGQNYTSCFTTCKNNGGTIKGCGDQCWSQAETCISNATKNPTYCGSTAALLGIAAASLAFRRKS